jgi:hypothetical protein
MSCLNSRLSVAATLVVLATLIASPVFARGGGGGGRGGAGRGAAGGGRHSAAPRGDRNVREHNQAGNGDRQIQQDRAFQAGPGNAIDARGLDNANLSKAFKQQGFDNRNGQAQDRANRFQNRNQPFSPAWYADHPGAWRFANPRAGVIAAASIASVGAWLDDDYYVPVDSEDDTVGYEETPSEDYAPQQTMANVAPDTQEWMTLGTYSLSSNQNAPPSVMLQLAVDHAGELRGVYYDSFTNTTHNVIGTLNPKTKQAQWSFDTNQDVTFQTSMDQLLQPTGSVAVNLTTGQQQWQLARVDQTAQGN